jgi:hypothetical protein
VGVCKTQALFQASFPNFFGFFPCSLTFHYITILIYVYLVCDNSDQEALYHLFQGQVWGIISDLATEWLQNKKLSY